MSEKYAWLFPLTLFYFLLYCYLHYVSLFVFCSFPPSFAERDETIILCQDWEQDLLKNEEMDESETF